MGSIRIKVKQHASFYKKIQVNFFCTNDHPIGMKIGRMIDLGPKTTLNFFWDSKTLIRVCFDTSYYSRP